MINLENNWQTKLLMAAQTSLFYKLIICKILTCKVTNDDTVKKCKVKKCCLYKYLPLGA